jgi:hypothetical protein
MKMKQWLKIMSFVGLVALGWASAKDDEPKLKGEILQLDVNALTITIADMTFWIDARTKIEDANSVHISFDVLEPGDFVELEYVPSRQNTQGFVYASKIELKR